MLLNTLLLYMCQVPVLQYPLDAGGADVAEGQAVAGNVEVHALLQKVVHGPHQGTDVPVNDLFVTPHIKGSMEPSSRWRCFLDL